MSDIIDIQAKQIEYVSNLGIKYNNSLLDEFYESFIKPITKQSIENKTDENILLLTHSNWVQAFAHGAYSFEAKKKVIDKCWEINVDIFEFFRSQFEEAYRNAALGFGQMAGSTMKIIYEERPHLKSRLDEFLDNEVLVKKLRDEAKEFSSINPHHGLSSLIKKIEEAETN